MLFLGLNVIKSGRLLDRKWWGKGGKVATDVDAFGKTSYTDYSVPTSGAEQSNGASEMAKRNNGVAVPQNVHEDGSPIVIHPDNEDYDPTAAEPKKRLLLSPAAKNRKLIDRGRKLIDKLTSVGAVSTSTFAKLADAEPDVFKVALGLDQKAFNRLIGEAKRAVLILGPAVEMLRMVADLDSAEFGDD